ncbi:MAG: GNAT family N-acetyltransferase [Ruminococcaceae bacterium]|nr:GNAT family N-acetyltransferase [Oscillospiraceae bacterium]
MFFENPMKIFYNLPSLHTERLYMRKMLPDDADDMFEYASLEEVTRYLLWRPHVSPSETRMYLYSLKREYSRGNHREWALIDKKTSKMIGTCGFTEIDMENKTGELGYVLNPKFHRQGYAAEATKKLLSIGFDYLGLERIEVKFMIENKASLSVAQKCGMTFEGVLRRKMLVKGIQRDIGYASILKDEYYLHNEKQDYSEFKTIKKSFFDRI